MSQRVSHRPPGTKTRAEAAAYLGISIRSLAYLLKARKVRCIRPTPRTPYFRQIDLDAYLSKTANKAA